MPSTLIVNKNISKIINGLEKLNHQEQLSILAQINATIILKKGVPSFTNPPKGLKPPTLSQIDSIKHKVRKEKVHAK
jgi:hypothetical protein